MGCFRVFSRLNGVDFSSLMSGSGGKAADESGISDWTGEFRAADRDDGRFLGWFGRGLGAGTGGCFFGRAD